MVLTDGDFWRPQIGYVRSVVQEARRLHRDYPNIPIQEHAQNLYQQFPNVSILEHARNLLKDTAPSIKKREMARRQPIQRGTVMQYMIPIVNPDDIQSGPCVCLTASFQ